MPSQSSEMNDVLEPAWNQFSRQLRTFIRVRVRDEETAEDILQKALLRIQAKIGTLRDMTKMESWTYQITRNAIIDYYRAQRPTGELAEIPVSWEDSHEDELVTRLVADVRDMAESLPHACREAFMLTSYAGLSQEQLAEWLGLS